MTFVSEKMVKDMNVRGQLLLLMTTYIALDNTVGVSGICSANKVYLRQTCPDPQSALGAIAELDEGGELKIQVALSRGARPHGTEWRLRIQRTVEDNADALLLLAVPCADLAGTTTIASASTPDSNVLCAFTALLAVRPGQNLWVWLEKLGRHGDLGCSFCEAMPVAVLVLRQEETLPPPTPPTLPPSLTLPPTPPPPPTCLHLGAVVAVSAAAALVVVAVAVLLCVVFMRRVALRQRLQKSSSAEETNRQCSSRRTPEWTQQVRAPPVPRRQLAEPTAAPPPRPPKAPSAPPATPSPSPPPSPARGPLVVVPPPPASPRFQLPGARPLPPLPARDQCPPYHL